MINAELKNAIKSRLDKFFNIDYFKRTQGISYRNTICFSAL